MAPIFDLLFGENVANQPGLLHRLLRTVNLPISVSMCHALKVSWRVCDMQMHSSFPALELQWMAQRETSRRELKTAKDFLT